MTLPLSMNTAVDAVGANAALNDVGAGAAATDYTDINSLEALKQNPNSPQALAGVAQQVEAMFLQMMLKSMREASLGAGIFDSNEGKLYQDMFDKQVSLSMSKHQNVGIGALLLRQLTHKSVPEGAPAKVESIGAKSAAITPSPRQFIARVLPSIEQAAKKMGVSPLGMLAQAALETGWGQRVIRNGAGSSSNNLFGIKAGSGWNGDRVSVGTLEYDGTVASHKRASFRAYGSIEASVDDFTRLISSSPRYKEALSSGADVNSYIRAIGASGYATDPEYANKLNQILNSDTMRTALAQRTAGLQK